MSPRKPHRRASSGSTAPDPAKKPDSGPAGERSAAAEPSVVVEPSVLKERAADDDPRVWGDGPEDRDSWLLEQRPPHWD
ncbi:hypothetical protein [Arthrobacter sp. Z1-15]